jgi:HAD superfamily hydrolase (TIGR01509 family)
MDKEIWNDQKKFNEQFFSDQGLSLDKLTTSEKIFWAKEFFFHINNELVDLVNCFPKWKMHYKNDEREEALNSKNLKEEYIDVYKYLLGLGQILGLSYEDIVETYKEKTEVVKQKYEQNKKIEELKNKKVIIFDIDGVINNYPDCFVEWVNKELGYTTKFSTVEQIKTNFSKKVYEELKAEYRMSGAKRTQPINEDTVKIIKHLKANNESIILFTNRPVSKYKCIYSDTLFWLQSNNIPYDAIYYSDFHQKEDIYKLNFDIKYIVEDNLENTKMFNSLGYKVFLLNKYYNVDINYKHDLMKRIEKVSEIIV